MLDKLKDIEKRFEAVNQQLCDPATAQDVKKTTELLKELKNLQPIVDKLREYEKNDSDAREAKELAVIYETQQKDNYESSGNYAQPLIARSALLTLRSRHPLLRSLLQLLTPQERHCARFLDRP